MNAITKTTMNKSKIGYDGEHFTWEPCGYGCSGGCPGCWARRSAKRQRKNCPDCADFKVHFHAERLEDPANPKKPATILACFHCDLFDPQRSFMDSTAVLEAACDAPQHRYIFLTQHPDVALSAQCYFAAHPNWYIGCTIRNQQDADDRLPTFLTIPGNLWISYEPAQGEVGWLPWLADSQCTQCGWYGFTNNDEDKRGLRKVYESDSDQDGGWVCPQCGASEEGCVVHHSAGYNPHGQDSSIGGIIIGHDNRRDALGTDTLYHIRSAVKQAQAAGVRVYVKQLWLPWCPRCQMTRHGPDDQICPCGEVMVYRLCRDPGDFPPDLGLRELSWSPK